MTRFRFRGHRAATSAGHQLKQQAYKDAKEASEKSHAECEKCEKKEKKEVKEEKFTLPGKYEGDHSIRKIYMDETLTYRGTGGRQMQVSRGREAHGGVGGLYGSVADSPVAARVARPAARPVARPTVQPVNKNVPAPARKPQRTVVAAPVRNPHKVAPTSTGTSSVPAKNVPTSAKAPAGDTGKGTSVTDRFTYAKTGGGAPAPKPSPGIPAGQAKSAGYDPGVKRPEIKAATPAGKLGPGFHGFGATPSGQAKKVGLGSFVGSAQAAEPNRGTAASGVTPNFEKTPVVTPKKPVVQPPAMRAAPAFKGAGRGASDLGPQNTTTTSSSPGTTTDRGPQSTAKATSPTGVPAFKGAGRGVGSVPSGTAQKDVGATSTVKVAEPTGVPAFKGAGQGVGPITTGIRKIQSTPSGTAQKDLGPSTGLTAAGAELKSIMAKDAPTQSSIMPGKQPVALPPGAPTSKALRNKIRDIAGPTFEEKIVLPEKYEGKFSVRKVYKDGD